MIETQLPKSVAGMLLSVVTIFALASADEPVAGPPPVDPGVIAVEFAGAVVGGAICASGLGYLFCPILDTAGSSEWRSLGGTVISGCVGYPLFCASGAWGGGRMSSQNGKFVAALVGALASTPLALSLAWTGVMVDRSPGVTLKSTPFYALAALLPPAGAVYAYNRSIPSPRNSGGNAGARWMPPTLAVLPERLAAGGLAPRLDCTLLNARF